MNLSSIFQTSLKYLSLFTFLSTIGIAIKVCWGIDPKAWPGTLLMPLAGLGAASLAATATLAVTETWSRRAHREALDAIRQQRERVYEELFLMLMSEVCARRPGSSQESFQKEMSISSAAATWAHPEVLASIAAWHSSLEEPDAKKREKLLAVAVAMRKDLAGELPTRTATVNELDPALLAHPLDRKSEKQRGTG